MSKTLSQEQIKTTLRKNLKKRKMVEWIFKSLGIGAVLIALSAVSFLLFSLTLDGIGAFRQSHLRLNVTLPSSVEVRLLPTPIQGADKQYVTDSNGNLSFEDGRAELVGITYESIKGKIATYDLQNLPKKQYQQLVAISIEEQYEQIIYQGLAEGLGLESIKGRQYRDLRKFIGLGAIQKLRKIVQDNPDKIGQEITVELPVHSVLDYWWRHGGEDAIANLEDVNQQLSNPNLSKEDLEYLSIQKAQILKGLSEKQVAWAAQLHDQKLLNVQFTARILTNLDSSEADSAGLKGALIGTAYTMLVTLVISFIVGVAAAVWLEQFAPKGKFSDFIEVNINNLAAVPSIVKGLLGLAIFQMLSKFNLGLQAGTPLLGGLVLSLIAMPTIIVASRAAIKAVPPSLKQGALGVGASDMQAVFHHVVPAALPGMLTGAIIGLAQALGETAPLLMIGMRGFIATPPDGINDPATTIAATIYNWFSLGKDSFNELASAAILILLLFLIVMNGLAVYLRKKFELDW